MKRWEAGQGTVACMPDVSRWRSAAQMMHACLPLPSVQVLMQRVRWQGLMLAGAETLLTLCDMKGTVLQQNQAAASYAGDWVRNQMCSDTASAARQASAQANYLAHLLQCKPQLLDEAMQQATVSV